MTCYLQQNVSMLRPKPTLTTPLSASVALHDVIGHMTMDKSIDLHGVIGQMAMNKSIDLHGVIGHSNFIVTIQWLQYDQRFL